MSGRYQQFEWETYLPDEWRIQDTENKQSSNGHIDHQELTTSMVKGIYKKSQQAYESMLGHNVAREQARTVMPVGQYTEFFTSLNLRNLFHFLELRADPHAQYEIRVYAEAIISILEQIDELKWSVEVFNDVRKLKEVFHGAMNKAFKNGNIEDLENYLKKYGN
jgi:thymidylate synthase (FAD)